MNGIVINIDPVIFHVGDFAVGWYSIAIIMAVIAAIMVVIREGRRKGISMDDVYSLTIWAIVAGLIGARLFHVMENLDYYSVEPWAIFAVQQGGLAIWGAVAGGALAVVIRARMKKLPLASLVDGAVPALLVGQIIGRLGCIVNGDAYGGSTSMPWGFIYTHPDARIPEQLWGIPTHPYPAYEMLWNIAVLIFLFRIRRHLKTEGLLFFVYVSLYALGRFALSFVRQEKVWFWGLQEAQVIALLAAAVSAAAVAYLLIKRRRPAGQGTVAVAG